MVRVTAFIDGFNLYHALDDTRLHHLKWVNLRSLCEAYISPSDTLTDVLYFSAYATWRPDEYKRHRVFVAALQSVGVTPVLGRFKEKDRACRRCGTRWKDHEEKETDGSTALMQVSTTWPC